MAQSRPSQPPTTVQPKYEFGRKVETISETEDNKISISWSNTREDQTTPSQGTIQADLLLAADGPSSKIRSLLPSICPPTPTFPPRTYAGYVAIRGTVPESQLPSSPTTPTNTPSASTTFLSKFTFHHSPGSQILAYTIPSALTGTLHSGTRLINWVWYLNFPWPTPTTPFGILQRPPDRHHHLHHPPLHPAPNRPPLPPHLANRHPAARARYPPPQFAFLVAHTTYPFIQAITDVPPPSNTSRYLGGKVILIGDALTQFRPHAAATTGQAARHALLLEEVLGGGNGDGNGGGEGSDGGMSWEEYDEQVMRFAREVQAKGVQMGKRSQFGVHPLQA